MKINNLAGRSMTMRSEDYSYSPHRFVVSSGKADGKALRAEVAQQKEQERIVYDFARQNGIELNYLDNGFAKWFEANFLRVGAGKEPLVDPHKK